MTGNIFVYFGTTAPQWARASSFTRFLDHTQRRTTVGRTPLDEWSGRRRDLYLTTHNTQNMPPVGFELTISAGEGPQTYVLDRAATGTGDEKCKALNYKTKTETSTEHCPCLRTANRRGQPFLTHWGRVTQICVFTLQLCKTVDANLRF